MNTPNLSLALMSLTMAYGILALVAGYLLLCVGLALVGAVQCGHRRAWFSAARHFAVIALVPALVVVGWSFFEAVRDVATDPATSPAMAVIAPPVAAGLLALLADRFMDLADALLFGEPCR